MFFLSRASVVYRDPFKTVYHYDDDDDDDDDDDYYYYYYYYYYLNIRLNTCLMTGAPQMKARDFSQVDPLSRESHAVTSGSILLSIFHSIFPSISHSFILPSFLPSIIHPSFHSSSILPSISHPSFLPSLIHSFFHPPPRISSPLHESQHSICLNYLKLPKTEYPKPICLQIMPTF